MPRWMRVARGMIGTGLTFAIGVGGFVFAVGVLGMATKFATPMDVVEIVSKFTVVSFIVGVAFSGVLSLVARGRSLERLSLRLVTALGAGGGLLYFLAIGINARKVWTPSVALLNFVLLLGLGASAAAATLLVARKAKRSLRTGDELQSLSEGSFEAPASQRESERASRL